MSIIKAHTEISLEIWGFRLNVYKHMTSRTCCKRWCFKADFLSVWFSLNCSRTPLRFPNEGIASLLNFKNIFLFSCVIFMPGVEGGLSKNGRCSLDKRRFQQLF